MAVSMFNFESQALGFKVAGVAQVYFAFNDKLPYELYRMRVWVGEVLLNHCFGEWKRYEYTGRPADFSGRQCRFQIKDSVCFTGDSEVVFSILPTNGDPTPEFTVDKVMTVEGFVFSAVNLIGQLEMIKPDQRVQDPALESLSNYNLISGKDLWGRLMS
jgi:hypothetical protein